MLYWLLYQKLFPYFRMFRIFRYLTFRTVFASLTALLIGLLIGPYVIDRLREFQIGQYIREEGETHSMSCLVTETIGLRKFEGRRCILQLGLRMISLLRAIIYFGLVRVQLSIRPNLPKCDAETLKLNYSTV